MVEVVVNSINEGLSVERTVAETPMVVPPVFVARHCSGTGNIIHHTVCSRAETSSGVPDIDHKGTFLAR